MAISEFYFGELLAETEMLMRKVKDHPQFENAVAEFWVTLKIMGNKTEMKFIDRSILVECWLLFLKQSHEAMDGNETDVDVPF